MTIKRASTAEAEDSLSIPTSNALVGAMDDYRAKELKHDIVRRLGHGITNALPDSVLCEVLRFLPLDNCETFLQATKGLWNRREVLLRRQQMRLTSPAEVASLLRLDLALFSKLLVLDMGKHCTDHFLLALPRKRGDNDDEDTCYLPVLQSISMVGSVDVTDEGLKALAVGRRNHLKRVDITFCRRTTYHPGTFYLRDTCPLLQELRRQPAWMDGTFLTPFDNDGGHTYWCDGTFRFERTNQSVGFICSLEELSGPNHVADKLQYSNFDPPAGWPVWSRYSYRPGVSLLNLSSTEASNRNGVDQQRREVLVAQRLAGIRPPKNLPTPDMVDWIREPGKSQYLDRHGQRLDENELEATNGNGNGNPNIDNRSTMITRMQVLPLKPFMPPQELVQMNQRFGEEMKASEREWFLDGGEAFLHHALDRE